MHARILVGGIFALILAASAAAGPVANGDFESAFSTANWSEKDAVPGNAGASPLDLTVAQAAGARPLGSGSSVLRVVARDHAQDGPLQGSFVSTAFRDALIANGNGRTYTTRVWVRLDPSAAEASVRCLLRWRDNSVQQIPLILAEGVLTGQDGWVEMTATARLEWSTSLTAATIDFECEQLHRGSAFRPVATWFPDYDLDDLRMGLDDDGDGLFDSEESMDHSQSTMSFSDRPDQRPRPDVR